MHNAKPLTAAVLAAAALLARPAGAVNVSQCETITSPGSYELVNDLKAPAGQDCLVINSFNVTIDLKGHVVTNDFFTGTGIRDSGHPEVNHNITIRNGTVSGWRNSGIDLVSTTNAVVENVTVTANGKTGIAIGTGQVRNNTLDGNQNVGILVNGSGIIASNYVSRSGGFAGIALGREGTVVNNVVFQSNGDGINAAPDGLIAGFVVSGNSVKDNGGFGLNVNCPSLVSFNASTDNTAGNMSAKPIPHGNACFATGNSLQ
jgi:hypothetical protein